jgi:cholesterol transport system auxiliary component
MRKSILAATLTAALAACLGGCVSLLPKSSPAQLYRFGDDAPAAATSDASTAGAAAPKIGIVLGQIGFPRASTSDGILTVTADQLAYISGVRWVAPARTLFQEAIGRQFQTRSRVVQIVNVGDVGPAGAVLRIDVTAFEVRYGHGVGDPAATVALTARLTRSDGRVLGQRDFSVVKAAPANSVSMIVKAFDVATDEALADLITWTDTQVSNATPVDPPAAVTSATSTSTSTTIEHRP